MCPIHGFPPNSQCFLCSSFCGGFVSGFINAPYKWNSGASRIISQKGVFLASPGRPEEAENRRTGEQVRAVRNLFNAPSALEVWRQMPQEPRRQLEHSGFVGLSQLGGSLAAARAATFSMSFLIGRAVVLNPRLRPLLIFRSEPAQIAAGTILATLSLQGAIAQAIAWQRRIFDEYPGTEDHMRRFLDEANK